MMLQKTLIKLSDDNWMQQLWEWADKYDISNEDIPRDRNKLLEIRQLNLMMVYFGLNNISADQWPKGKISNSFLTSLVKRGYLPEEIGRLTQLKKLCINYNFIERLPDSIVNLKNIKELCLCHNQDLVLTLNQKLWIRELERKGAIVEYDEDLMNRRIEEITES